MSNSGEYCNISRAKNIRMVKKQKYNVIFHASFLTIISNKVYVTRKRRITRNELKTFLWRQRIVFEHSLFLMVSLLDVCVLN